MTKQLFSQLDDLAAEKVVGGGAKFYTAKVEWTDVNDDSQMDAGDTYVWSGGWNENSAKGKGSHGGGSTNNRYASVDGLTEIKYFFGDGEDDFVMLSAA